MSSNFDLNERPAPDQVLVDIADYVCDFVVESDEAYDTARNCLMDTLGCGFLALRFPECTKLLGPLVEGTVVPHGARVPGTQFRLDPVKAAWDIGCIIRCIIGCVFRVATVTVVVGGIRIVWRNRIAVAFVVEGVERRLWVGVFRSILTHPGNVFWVGIKMVYWTSA